MLYRAVNPIIMSFFQIALMSWLFCANAMSIELESQPETEKLVATPAAASIPYNVSHYIYHDLNTNGMYDSHDRVLAGIDVTLTMPDGTQKQQRSNIHGFVNFSTMLNTPSADIFMPGDYVFTVNPPPGWKISSHNKVQSIIFSANTSSRAGITATIIPEPTGLIQNLVISGQLAYASDLNDGVNPDNNIIRLSGPGDEMIEINAQDARPFTLPVRAGEWTLDIAHADQSGHLTRTIVLNNTPVYLGNLVIGSTHSSDSGQDLSSHTEDFEAITTAVISKVPRNDSGLKWTNMIAVENATYRGDGYINNTVSGHYIGYNTSGYPVLIERTQPFDFLGGYFGVAWPAGEGEKLVVKAWYNDELVATDTFSLSVYGPVWFDAAYMNITRLELATGHFWQFVADDLLFRL